MRLILSLLMLFAHFGLLKSQYVFSINDFKATQDKLSLVGNATYYQDRLRITPAVAGQEGACWYKQRQIDLTRGFETEFVFLISETSPEPGDGFAFVMQSQSDNALGGTGDAVGYKGIPYVMAIEFDTKDDGEGSSNHINLSFYNPDAKEYRRYATVHEIPEITDGREHFTRILYVDGELQVFIDSYMFPVLSVRIDIASRIGATDNQAWMGFTASTSSSFANHDLLQWSLTEFADTPSGIDEAKVEVVDAETIQVNARKLKVRVWDHNTIDGDIVSLKWADTWVLSEYTLTGEAREIEVTLQGFEQRLILFANNVGQVPPNTAMISVFDGVKVHRIELNADFEHSESLLVQYRGVPD